MWGSVLEERGELRQLRRADLVTCVSSELAETIAASGIDADKILVTPNMADPARFEAVDRAKMRASLGLTDRFVVGWVGSFRRFHALDVLLDAFEMFARSHPSATLLLVGDGPERARCREYAARFPPGQVVLPGPVPFDQVPDWISTFDVGVIPAQAGQAFHYSPLKLQEYHASHVAVIAPDIGQMSTSIHDGLNGLLYQPGDHQQLAERLEALLRDPSSAVSAGRRGARGNSLARLRHGGSASRDRQATSMTAAQHDEETPRALLQRDRRTRGARSKPHRIGRIARPWLEWRGRPLHRGRREPTQLVSRCRLLTPAWSGIGRARSIVELARALRAHKPDIVFANGLTEAAAATLALAGLRQPPRLAVWVHNTSVPSITRAVGPLIRRRRGAWAAVSDWAADLAESSLGDVGCTVIPNPISSNVVGARSSYPDDRIRIGYFGSDRAHKGFDLLPTVIEQMAEEPVVWRLYTWPVVDQPAWPRVRALEELGLIEHVRSLSDVGEGYGAVDIVFVPSLIESFCRVVVEANLNGLPVVASDLPPIRQLTQREQHGDPLPRGRYECCRRRASRTRSRSCDRHGHGGPWARGRVSL